MRVQRATSGFVTSKWPYAPEPTACTTRSGIRSRLKRASFSSRCWSWSRTGPRGPAVWEFWLSATGAPDSVRSVSVIGSSCRARIARLGGSLGAGADRSNRLLLASLITGGFHGRAAHAAPARVRGRRGRPQELPPRGARLSRHAARAQRADPPARGRCSTCGSSSATAATCWITAAGEELVRRARAVLDEVRGMVEAARGFQHPLRGLLRVGVIPTIAPYLFPRVLPRVRRRYPGAAAAPARGTHGGAGRAAAARRARPARRRARSAARRARDARRSSRIASSSRCPAAHRLAKRRRLREGDLAGEAMLLLTEGHCLREQALAACSARGIDEIADFRASSLATLVEMVSGGEGVTLLPELSVAGRGAAPRPRARAVRAARRRPARSGSRGARRRGARPSTRCSPSRWCRRSRTAAKPRGRVAKARALGGKTWTSGCS